ncbi:MAG: hypothetical protein ACI4AO_07365, partial [Anaerotignum sp.]
STKKFLISQEIRNFSLYFSAKSLPHNLTFALTDTLTNTAKVPYRTGHHRAGFPRSVLLFYSFLKSFFSFTLRVVGFGAVDFANHVCCGLVHSMV